MMTRLGHWLLTIAICLDQLAQVLIRGPKYVFLNGPRPSADETISDWVGQSADAGIPLGIFARKIVDFIMQNPNHCQQAISDDGKD